MFPAELRAAAQWTHTAPIIAPPLPVLQRKCIYKQQQQKQGNHICEYGVVLGVQNGWTHSKLTLKSLIQE